MIPVHHSVLSGRSGAAMTSYEERLRALCKRLDLGLHLDRNGDPDILTLALIGVKLLRQESEFRSEWNADTYERYKDPLDTCPEDLMAIHAIEQAAGELGVNFSRVLYLALPLLVRNGWLPTAKHGNGRTMHAERLLRLKRAIDAERAERYAQLKT